MASDTQLLDGMVIFSEVVSRGSFTKAAESTGHSTSYISKEINKLEERLKVRLLHRTTRTLSLTPEGEMYFERCQQLIQDVEELEETLSGKNAEPRGTLKISCPITFGLSRIRPILAKYSAQYPEVNLDVDLSDHKVDMIAEGIDVSIRGTSSQLEDSTLISQKILTSDSATFASPDYLKSYGTPKHPSELKDHMAICYRLIKNPSLWTYWEKDGTKKSVKVKSKLLTNSPQLELEMCKEGLGITRMPKFNLSDEFETGELVELFADYPKVQINMYLIYPSRKHMSAKVSSFIEFVKQELESEAH
ncbi:putative Transcriptional regulator, LysR family [Vibrio nigripulchritudo SOn1]|uniref:Transcriptional regulator, LysR family n=1 Tax=Vibrio nigripulchritudo SOn1 TaxID=1238450 RepID=A0AAV2VU94_9VIBR|nr:MULTISPECIES: LysR family transcriptional regulator [Vibrio]UAB72517.1 LysR family transcriptional regulator [Vibrio sp. SCSIO 43132]CCO47958.1 putative Transcriptional regulator, LysR family [Vibrio nigripulchritudo SOn1]